MNAHPDPGTSTRGGIARNRSGSTRLAGTRDEWTGLFGPLVRGSTQAAMAILSRYANDTLSQQVQHAYGVAERARDYARRAATIAERECPEGAVREALLDALLRQEESADALMRAVLRYGREHGRLAFAFPVYQ